jgi:hypothetical protein
VEDVKNTTRSNWNSLHSELSLNFIFFEKYKPQMNADERRYISVTEFAAQSTGSIHRKECEERKAEEQKSLRPLRSLRLINFHGIPTAQGNKAKVVFQTGFIGSTGW